MAYLLEWFIDLSGSRRSGMSGPEPLAPADMLAHAMLTRRWPEAWEYRALARLDLAWRKAWHEAHPPAGSTPPADPTTDE